jgi:hypothetical protein
MSFRFTLLAGAIFLAACASFRTPLTDTRDSPAAVAQAVIEAVTAGNSAALASLALSEQEFREHIWPELPSARPERNLPFSYVWGDLHQKSGASLAATLARYRGQRLTLVDVRFGDATTYDGYTVHRDSVFVVRTPDGTTDDVRLCGSMVEQSGRWKVFSYVVGD